MFIYVHICINVHLYNYRDIYYFLFSNISEFKIKLFACVITQFLRLITN